jgi:ABC-type glycerol-3-phosphate transport system permease component
MFENRRAPLASRDQFLKRLLRSVITGTILIMLALFLGMSGYHYFEKMVWIDAFVNAAMILSGMGPIGALATPAGKIFAGCYALFSGLIFILIISIVFAPLIHRYFHKFHLNSETK